MIQYDISVIIPTYNRLDILKKTLRCINNQTICRDKYQVIVVDDASTDGTGEYLRTLEKIEYHINEVNKGRAVTRNIGIKNAKSKLILFIDDDIWADAKLLEMHIKKHQQCVNIVVGAIKPSLEIEITAVNVFFNRHHEWCLREMKKYENSLPYYFLKTANVSMPKAIFDKIGYFDERFYHYGCEDTELGARLKNNAYEIVFEDKAVGYHYHNENVEGMVNKIVDSVKSSKQIREIYNDHAGNYSGFFIPTYHKNNSVKGIIYNAIKCVLFLEIIRGINELTIKLLNKNRLLVGILSKINLPILKMQYLHKHEVKKCE